MKTMKLALLFTVSLALTASAQDPASDARAAVEAAGGMVMETAIGSGEWVVGFHIHGKDVVDADIAHVALMTGVVELNLGGTGIGDAGLYIGPDSIIGKQAGTGFSHAVEIRLTGQIFSQGFPVVTWIDFIPFMGG